MPKTEPVTDAILARRARGGAIKTIMLARSRLIFLKGQLKAVGNDKDLLNYFPIAVIATVETFFRSAIATLLDRDKTRMSRVLSGEFGKRHKFDLSVFSAVASRTISVGELVAHVIPISRFEHIESYMSVFLESSFSDALQTVSSRWDVGIEKLPPSPIIRDYAATIQQVVQAFEYRHVIAHEIPDKLQLNQDEMTATIDAAIEFLDASASVFFQTLAPNSPLTQSDMNERAYEDFREADGELRVKVAEVSALLDDRRRVALESAQQAWLAFREAHEKYADLFAEGGSMAPMLSFLELRKITRERVEQLQRSRFYFQSDLEV